MGILQRFHNYIYAHILRRFRIRHAVKAFTAAHAVELKETPVYNWPMVMARQASEIQAVKAGRLDATIVTERKSWAWPYLPGSVQRLSIPVLKSTPYNLRRMSRTPVPRRAMNLIKGALINQPYEIRPIAGIDPIDNEDEQKARIKICKKVFSHPNNTDSFQTFMEQGLEDFLVFGAFVAEMRLTPDPERPMKMWPVNVESIRIFVSWSEGTEEMPHYAQMTGLKGERGAILFYDDELMYIKDNPSTDSPFGLGKMEVAFMSVNDLLGVQGMAGRAGSDQVHKTFMWWETPQNEAHVQIVRRHIQNELEGQAKLSLITGMKKPEVIEVTPVTEADLLLNWQELLIRMIANGFDMSAMALGVEHDVNRAVGEVLDDKDFRSAVVPAAKRIQTSFTRDILHRRLGWTDLELVFLKLDDPDTQTQIDIFTKLYSINATTPNRVLKALNMEELESPFANMTQFECMLANIDAMVKSQDVGADHAAQRQLTVQDITQQRQDERMKDMPVNVDPNTGGPAAMPTNPGQKQLSPGGGGGGQPPGGGSSMTAPTPANISRGGQPRSPRALTLPKFPIRGSKYSARKIAMMPVNQITDVWKATGYTAAQFLQALDDNESGILQQMTEEAQQFFLERLEYEQSKPKTKISDKLLNKWRKELGIRVRKQNKRANDMSTWLEKRGLKPGMPGAPNPDSGKAGKLNKGSYGGMP